MTLLQRSHQFRFSLLNVKHCYRYDQTGLSPSAARHSNRLTSTITAHLTDAHTATFADISTDLESNLDYGLGLTFNRSPLPKLLYSFLLLRLLVCLPPAGDRMITDDIS